MSHLPQQRWLFYPDNAQILQEVVTETGLSPLIAQILINRGNITPSAAEIFVNPDLEELPLPIDVFTDLNASVEILIEAIAKKSKIAICGDYDADGMTSTALLLRAFRHLGADIDYAIPSRLKEGYGLNIRIIEEFAAEGVELIITVDNGIAAHEAVARAKELGLQIIITDHHDLPATLPVADAILNPKMLPTSCPFWGLAGVGMAYVLAVTTAQRLNKLTGLTSSLLELFTLGTIADMAPLVGINRRLLKKGLRRLPKSEILGIQALMQVSGISEKQAQLDPEDIGFTLGPRINAVGRIGDPQVVIELLTTEDQGIALERARQCEQLNCQRQDLCKEIEEEAIKLVETTVNSWQNNRVLVLTSTKWHHGVIGLVASHLAERYGVPTFIATLDKEGTKLKGSARTIEEFDIFAALSFCDEQLESYGGHRAAGGFSLPTENLAAFQARLREFAHQCLKPEDLQPLIKIDAQVDFPEITLELYQELNSLNPWGTENEFPIFWTPRVRILEQSIIGKTREHLSLKLTQGNTGITHKAIAWRWACFCPLPSPLDIAYKLQENTWQGNTELQLQIVGVRMGSI